MKYDIIVESGPPSVSGRDISDWCIKEFGQNNDWSLRNDFTKRHSMHPWRFSTDNPEYLDRFVAKWGAVPFRLDLSWLR